MLPFVKGKDTTGKEAETLKRLLALMMVVAVTAALLACTKGGCDNEDENDTPNPEPQYAGADTMTLRVVGDGENGTLILAGETEVYALPLEGVTLYLDGGSVSASEIESGMSAEVWYTGGVQETYPAKFSQVVAVSLSREENAQYDLCGLYLQVLEDLWNEDDGLNGGAEVVSVDLSKAPGGLTAGEKAAVAYIYAQKHGVQGLTMTFDELREEATSRVKSWRAAARPIRSRTVCSSPSRPMKARRGRAFRCRWSASALKSGARRSARITLRSVRPPAAITAGNTPSARKQSLKLQQVL